MAQERVIVQEKESIWNNKFVKAAVIVVAVVVGIGVTLDLLNG